MRASCERSRNGVSGSECWHWPRPAFFASDRPRALSRASWSHLQTRRETKKPRRRPPGWNSINKRWFSLTSRHPDAARRSRHEKNRRHRSSLSSECRAKGTTAARRSGRHSPTVRALPRGPREIYCGLAPPKRGGNPPRSSHRRRSQLGVHGGAIRRVIAVREGRKRRPLARASRHVRARECRRVAAGSTRKITLDNARRLQTAALFRKDVRQFAWTPRSDEIAILGFGGTLEICTRDTLGVRRSLGKGHSLGPFDLRGDWCAAGPGDESTQVYLFNASTGAKSRSRPISATPPSI